MAQPSEDFLPVAQPESSSRSADWKARLRTMMRDVPEGSPLFPFEGRDHRASEQYRIIRTKIVQHESRLQIVAVSSPQVGDGKSVTTANVAGALALKKEVSVLLIDADLRRSALAALFDVPSEPGLSDVLSGECTLEEAIINLHLGGVAFCFLPGGRKRGNPAELLASSRWTQTCDEFRRLFDFCVLDTPPIGVVTDYELIQPVADGIVLVVRPDHTSRTRCAMALQSIAKGKLVGAVVNCVPDFFLSRHNSHEYSYYRRADD